MLKSYDVLAVQEHWLFTFQLSNFDNHFNTHYTYSKAVDAENPLPPTQKPRGYGGVAILYRKNLDFKVNKKIHGDSRIVVIEIQSNPHLCICCVYMPSRNSKGNSKADDSYQSCLDQIDEILKTYNRTHAVLIIGDLNASLVQRKGNIQDLQLRAFVDSNSLKNQQCGIHTFSHPNKSDKAEIDYVFYNRAAEMLVKCVAVESDETLNTSDHVPVFAFLNLDAKQKVVDGNRTIQCKPRWEKCDRQVYECFVEENLKTKLLLHPGTSVEQDILYPLAHLNTILRLATEQSIPNYKPEIKAKKKRQRPWTEQIHQAVKKCRLTWWEWRKAGSPVDHTDPYVCQMKEAKRSLRKEQRRESAKIRTQKIENIMNTENDSRTFFKLIKDQRKSSNTQTETLIVENQICDTDQKISQGWAKHFQTLATPLQNENFDEKHKDLVTSDIACINSICESESREIRPIQLEEVQTALGKLKNNKAADVMGLTSEHLKLGGQTVEIFLVELLNYLIKAKKVSSILKEGIITPIYKKGDSSNPGNYRGITVTPVILKVLEHVLNHRHNAILNPTQSRLQRGFTTGCSSLNAAVIVTECIQESKNVKQNLVFTTLDAQKAFDVVDQNSLLRRLYLDGIQGDDWLLIQDMYSDCSSRVKWAGMLSDPVNLRQGVRQGGVLSTSHYKRFNNPLLLQLEERHTDVKIGSINIPHITVADDVAVMSRKYGSQQIKIWDVEKETQRERYCINPPKSSTLFFNFAKSSDSECTDIYMAGDTISNDSKTTHLGIHREVKDKPNIEEKINIGRRTAYSIMGAGFHSGNGLKVCLNGFLWSTFIVPRFTYGLEVLTLTKKDIEMLEKFQRKSLKQIQSLPDKTPNVVTLGLLGILPVEAVIDKNALNLFMNVIRDKNSIEYQIAERQLAMKDSQEKCWFDYIKSILETYNMPSIYSLFDEQPSKSKWKKTFESISSLSC